MSSTSLALRQSLFPNVPPFINYLPIPDEKPSSGSGGPATVTPPVDLHVSNQMHYSIHKNSFIYQDQLLRVSAAVEQLGDDLHKLENIGQV
jgi:hypothetical protein